MFAPTRGRIAVLTRSVLSVCALAILAACRGGSPAGMMPASSGSNGTASFTVMVPSSASAGASVPRSITVTVASINGIASYKPLTTTVNLVNGNSGCSALSGGGLSCVVTVSAPKGNVTFSLATFDGLNGTGNTLATQRTNAVVNGNQNTKCPPKHGTSTGART